MFGMCQRVTSKICVILCCLNGIICVTLPSQIKHKKIKNMYQFNSELFKDLPKILGMPVPCLCDYCNILPNNYRRWQVSGKPPIATVINLCNGMKIPSAAFINNGVAELVATKENLLMWGRFSDITFCLDRLRTDLTDGIGLSYTQIGRFINRSTSTAINWLNPNEGTDTVMTFPDFLLICNQFKLWPMNYIADTNHSLVLLPNYRKSVKQADLSQITSRLSNEKKALFDKILAAVEARHAYNIPISDEDINSIAAEYHV